MIFRKIRRDSEGSKNREEKNGGKKDLGEGDL
jgi:hypothetical protein